MSRFNDLKIELRGPNPQTGTIERIVDLQALTKRIVNLSFTTIYPGGLFGSCSFFIPRNILYPFGIGRTRKIKIRNGVDNLVWEGEVNDFTDVFSTGATGTRINASGIWGEKLGRQTVEKNWADERIDNAVWAYDETATGADKCTVDRGNRIQLTPKQEEWATDEQAAVVYTMPTNETIKRVVLDYDFVC